MVEAKEFIEKIVENVDKVMIGKKREILNILKGIIAGGHILIEDVPGVGKTTMIKAISKTLDLSYSRIQFTPDLLPSDIIGVSIFNQREMEFQFKKGPIFANIVLADEINRTSPKTQSALLEVMEENQVSEGNNTFQLDKPFFVFATQNPIEYEGTFNLPEAQLDRFMMKLSIGYPDKQSEKKVLQIYKNSQPLQEIEPVVSGEQILWLQQKAREIIVSDPINEYIIDIAEATRKNNLVVMGMSTRAALALLRVSQATALIAGRTYVIPEDIKENAVLVLSHRLIPSSEARSRNIKSETIIDQILKSVPVPKVK
ncbi:MoxR family ATPase [Clostridium sp. 19966]|uniref:AAA family ATPase n=1 Tax=Clostridium sp. 19966 TaxID=2768166 RepID=UPI0028DE2987|nr:MoxR family ATPase [Clostridium sp. 19966]MDT8718507.1 MoxR family ATPase [Clostridium sp. 19966]